MPRFEWPWVLAALGVLPFLEWGVRRKGLPAVSVNWGRPGKRQAARPVLRGLALAMLICAAAGARWDGARGRDVRRTIGIQVVVDSSGSMNETDMTFEGKSRSRIDIVRELSKEFVLGNGADLKGRMDDTIGVIAFAEYPVTLCPLMIPDETMRPVLNGIRVIEGPGGQGTAIGDAIAVAAARFHRSESTAGEGFRSKAIVLLTDGENNSGTHSVAEGAALAKQWGVRVYAIGIRPAGVTRVTRANAADPAWSDLELLAETTGGVARLVTDGSSLQGVYREIDQLERGERRAARFTGGWGLIYALTAAGMALLTAEVVLGETRLRRIP